MRYKAIILSLALPIVPAAQAGDIIMKCYKKVYKYKDGPIFFDSVWERQSNEWVPFCVDQKYKLGNSIVTLFNSDLVVRDQGATCTYTYHQKWISGEEVGPIDSFIMLDFLLLNYNDFKGINPMNCEQIIR